MKIKDIRKIAEPGRCITCDCKIKKEQLQCWWDKRNNPIKQANK